jgi:hypothetical protein
VVSPGRRVLDLHFHKQALAYVRKPQQLKRAEDDALNRQLVLGAIAKIRQETPQITWPVIAKRIAQKPNPYITGALGLEFHPA